MSRQGDVLADVLPAQVPSTLDIATLFLRALSRSGASAVEDARALLGKLGEDGLTWCVLLPLREKFVVTSQEEANGSSDVKVHHVVPGMRALTGEAKIVRGATDWDKYSLGVTKLVSRFNAGTEHLALMLAYCREPDRAFARMRAFEERVSTERTGSYLRAGALGTFGLADDLGCGRREPTSRRRGVPGGVYTLRCATSDRDFSCSPEGRCKRCWRAWKAL